MHEHARSCARPARIGIAASPNGSILIEECLLGWKEFELEVMRDRADNCVIVCSIENFDPMGVHTGDSITVAPAQTLTDRCYQDMRDAALRVMRAIKVEAGGSNIQFAVHPDNGEMRVIEMNPRVSRILGAGEQGDRLPDREDLRAAGGRAHARRDSERHHAARRPACFEPTLDYCVIKIPRWAFEKFRGTDRRLGTRMKSVGEVMAIGRTFPEALLKGCARSRRGTDVLPDAGDDRGDARALRASLARAESRAPARPVPRARRGREPDGAVAAHRHRSVVPPPDARA